MQTIEIPSKYTYLSDVPEFSKGLPYDCVLDKQQTWPYNIPIKSITKK